MTNKILPYEEQPAAALADFYLASYTKSELATIIATWFVEGTQPPMPKLDELQHLEPLVKGRPSAQLTAYRRMKLRRLLQHYYPEQVDLRILAGLTNLHVTTLERLQKDLKFLSSLPGGQAQYFAQLPRVSQARLTPAWRAAFDLHFYWQTVANPGKRLPFYRSHRIVWGAIGNESARQLGVRDNIERRRAIRPELRELAEAAGWPAYIPDLYKDSVLVDVMEAPCAEDCVLTRAWLDKVDIAHIETARELIAPADWLDNEWVFVRGTNCLDIAAEYLGVT
jgi:hypothetical protein